MKFTLKLIAIICGLALFIACKKNNDDNLSAKGKLLVTGKWQMSASTATLNHMGKDTTFDIYATDTKECDKDDFILFASKGTCTIDESVNKCTDDDQVETSKWALLNNEAKLALVDGNPDTFDIEELTGAQLKMKIIKPNSSGTPVTFINTYKNIK